MPLPRVIGPGLLAVTLLCGSSAIRGEQGGTERFPGCRRGGAHLNSLDQELNRVTAEPRCPVNGRSLLPVAPACNAGWAYRQTANVPGDLWVGPDYAVLTVAQQDNMIVAARSRAGLITTPPGTALYRITYSHQCSGGGGGMGVTCRVRASAHFGICGGLHN